MIADIPVIYIIRFSIHMIRPVIAFTDSSYREGRKSENIVI